MRCKVKTIDVKEIQMRDKQWTRHQIQMHTAQYVYQ